MRFAGHTRLQSDCILTAALPLNIEQVASLFQLEQVSMIWNTGL